MIKASVEELWRYKTAFDDVPQKQFLLLSKYTKKKFVYFSTRYLLYSKLIVCCEWVIENEIKIRRKMYIKKSFLYS